MKKNSIIQIGTVIATVMVIASLLLSRQFTPLNSANLWKQVNDSAYESITSTASHWILTAGGRAASTHYARLRYGLPEFEGKVFTEFYLRETIQLSSTFYSDLTTGLRLMNTDNYRATLNGSPIGAGGGNEMRASVEVWSDKTVRVRLEHQSTKIVDLYISEPSPAFLSPGVWHTVELYGNLSIASPWYFRVDGVVIASGVAMMSTDTVPVSERVMTRAVWGIDGAWNQDAKPLTVLIRDVMVADYDAGGVALPSTPSPTVQPSTPTFTTTPTPTITATFTGVPTITRTPTFTPVLTPTAVCVPALNVWVCDKKP